MATFSESIEIKAPVPAVWDALADIGSISVWNPGGKTSERLEGIHEGMGAKRICELGSKNYLIEDVVEWQPDQVLTMRVVETNLPFKAADIRFTLIDIGDGTQVTVSPEYELKYGGFGKLLDAVFVGRSYRAGMRDLLNGLKAHIEASRTT